MTRKPGKSYKPTIDDQQSKEDEVLQIYQAILEHLKSESGVQASNEAYELARLLFELTYLQKKVEDLLKELREVQQSLNQLRDESKEPQAAHLESTSGLRIKNPDDELDKFLAKRIEMYKWSEELDERLDSEPLETVRGVGTVRRVIQDGVLKEEIEPDAIQIGRRIYLFMPGEEVEVPETVAKEYRLFCRERERLQKRRK